MLVKTSKEFDKALEDNIAEITLAAGNYSLRKHSINVPTSINGNTPEDTVITMSADNAALFNVTSALTMKNVTIENVGAVLTLEGSIDNIDLYRCYMRNITGKAKNGSYKAAIQTIKNKIIRILSYSMVDCSIVDASGGIKLSSPELYDVKVEGNFLANLRGSGITLGVADWESRNMMKGYKVVNNFISGISLSVEGSAIACLGSNAVIEYNMITGVTTESSTNGNSHGIYTKCTHTVIRNNTISYIKVGKEWYNGNKLYGFGILAKGLHMGEDGTIKNSIPGHHVTIWKNTVSDSNVGLGTQNQYIVMTNNTLDRLDVGIFTWAKRDSKNYGVVYDMNNMTDVSKVGILNHTV